MEVKPQFRSRCTVGWEFQPQAALAAEHHHGADANLVDIHIAAANFMDDAHIGKLHVFFIHGLALPVFLFAMDTNAVSALCDLYGAKFCCHNIPSI